MNIGILTFHLARNYGAVFQAYALQRIIEDNGYEVNIINYDSDFLSNTYKINKFRELKNIKQIIKYFLTNKDIKEKDKKFQIFREKYFKLSKQTYYKYNINTCNSEYDCFFVGSEQVWNFNLNGEDKTFYLDFVNDNNKKNSYAASFGYDKIPNEYVNLTRELLSKFNNLSVREKQGNKIISELINKDSEVVLDPTLLLDKYDWEKISSNKKEEKEYILVYEIASTPNLIRFSKMLARKKKCEIIYINNTYKKYSGGKNIKNASPEEFLSYLLNAKYIVTSSFHGLVFSINFEKDFFYELDNKKINNNSRLENIVDIFDLKSREIVDGNNNDIDKRIDYSKVNKILYKERKKSIDFIKKSIENLI